MQDFYCKVHQFTIAVNPENGDTRRISFKRNGDYVAEALNNDKLRNKAYVAYAKMFGKPIREFNGSHYIQVFGVTINIRNGNQVTNPDILRLF